MTDATEKPKPEQDAFVELAVPIIARWFNEQPISADIFVFENDSAVPLARELWGILSKDIGVRALAAP